MECWVGQDAFMWQHRFSGFTPQRSIAMARFLVPAGLVFGVALVAAGGVPAGELPDSLPHHPRLLLSKVELPGIRERAQGSCSVHFRGLRKQADNWLETRIELPDRGGQWYHWYSCPKHGARLRNEGPTRHICPVDGEALTGYPYDDVVLSTVHNGFAGAVRTLGIVYQVTGDKRYAVKAREILLAYAVKYESYPLHNIHGAAQVGGGKVGPQTLDESTWLITMVEGADCVWDTFAPSERRQMEEGLLRPATAIIRQHKMGIHNIQCWKNSAVGLTGLLLGDMELVREAVEGQSGYHNQIQKGVQADGPWFEGAWTYHFYTVSALLHLTEGAFHSGINLYGAEFKRMFDAPLAMAMPNLTLPAFNDSTAVDLRGTVPAYETAMTRYKDPEYGVVATGSGTDAALLHGVALDALPPERTFFSRNFTNSGNAILTAGKGKDTAWLCLKYGAHGGGHGHPDKLNFVLYGHGQVLSPDPGTANYGVPIQAEWFRTTIAHNTLTVDGRSQMAAQGRCIAFIATNGLSALTAHAGEIYPGVTFYRTVALLDKDLVVFLDQIRSEKVHTFDLAYHNHGTFIERPDAAPWHVPPGPGYSHLRDAKASQTTSGLALAFAVKTGETVRWTMAPGEATIFITGTGVGSHTEDRVPMVIARREGKTADYIWFVDWSSGRDRTFIKPERLNGGPSATAVRVTRGSSVWTIVANPQGVGTRLGASDVPGKLSLFTGDAERELKAFAP